jgi:hypothetical protein
MLIFGCLAVVLFAGIVAYALYQRREVRAGLKIPGAAFFFEAKDHEQGGPTRKI